MAELIFSVSAIVTGGYDSLTFICEDYDGCVKTWNMKCMDRGLE